MTTSDENTPEQEIETTPEMSEEEKIALSRERWDVDADSATSTTTENSDSNTDEVVSEAESPNDAETPELDDTLADISEDGPELSEDEIPGLAQRMEALLFVSPKPMSARRLAELLGFTSVVPVRQAAEFLRGTFEGHAFELRDLAGGYQLMTRHEFEDEVLKLQKQKKAKKLTPGALETLAVLAYKQPITRSEIDNIRGVHSDHHIRALAERNVVKVVGRKTDGTFGGGAPALYGTTTQFLNEFGLKSLTELPTTDDMIKGGPKDSDDDEGGSDTPDEEAGILSVDSQVEAGDTTPENDASTDEDSSNISASHAVDLTNEGDTEAGQESDESAEDEVVASESADEANA